MNNTNEIYDKTFNLLYKIEIVEIPFPVRDLRPINFDDSLYIIKRNINEMNTEDLDKKENENKNENENKKKEESIAPESTYKYANLLIQIQTRELFRRNTRPIESDTYICQIAWKRVKDFVKNFTENGNNKFIIPINILFKYLNVSAIANVTFEDWYIQTSLIKMTILNEDFEFFEWIVTHSLDVIKSRSSLQNEIEEYFRCYIPVDKNKVLLMMNLWLNLGFRLSHGISPASYEGLLRDYFPGKYINYFKLWVEDLCVPVERLYTPGYASNIIYFTKEAKNFHCQLSTHYHKKLFEEAFEYFYSMGMPYIHHPEKALSKSHKDDAKKLKMTFIIQNAKWNDLLKVIDQNLENVLIPELVSICKNYNFSQLQLNCTFWEAMIGLPNLKPLNIK